MNESSLKDTLASLRKRSWEMELLLSGFVLVLLLPVPDFINEQGSIWLSNLNVSIFQQLFTIAFLIGLFGSRILITNLIIYLLLRGFWVGIVGLASAFPEGIKWSRIIYREPYQRYLKRKTPGTESYIILLNKISSLVFSFSFLLVFLVIAFFLTLLPFIFLVVTIKTYFASYPETHWVVRALQIIIPAVAFIYFGLALTFLIDFLSFGLIKRITWKPFVRIYFPLYRFFRKLTLAPLYTPIYYTLISNVSKRTVTLVLTTYLALFFFFTNFSYNEEVYFPKESGPATLLNRYYEDRLEEFQPTPVPIIPSEYVLQNHLRLFLPYLVTDNDSLQKMCPEVELFREPGFNRNMRVQFNTDTSPDTATNQPSPGHQIKNVQAAIDCLADLYQIQINDSLYRPSVYYFYRRDANQQPGLVTYLSLNSLPLGPHLLTIKKRDYGSSAPHAYETYYIPFVKD